MVFENFFRGVGLVFARVMKEFFFVAHVHVKAQAKICEFDLVGFDHEAVRSDVSMCDSGVLKADSCLDHLVPALKKLTFWVKFLFWTG